MLTAAVEVVGPAGSYVATSGEDFQIGHAVHVRANQDLLDAHDPMTHKYEWQFVGSTGAYATLPGFNAAHHYQTTGDNRQIKLTVTPPSGAPVEYTISVDIKAETRTEYYVSATGTGSGTQANPMSLASAITTLGNVDNNIALLFKKGDTFVLSDAIDITGDNVVFGTYGTGARPIFESSQTPPTGGSSAFIAVASGANNVTIEGLSFGEADSGFDKGVSAGGTNVTIRDCHFDNLAEMPDKCIRTERFAKGVLIADNVVDDEFRAYFTYMFGDEVVFLHNDVGNSDQSHHVRFGQDQSLMSEHVLAYDNTFNNWADLHGGDTDGSSYSTFRANFGSYLYVAGNDFQGGTLPLGAFADGGAYIGDVDHVIIENNHFTHDQPETLTDGLTAAIVVTGDIDGVMIRNNIIEVDDRIAVDLNLTGGNVDASNVNLLHNTLVNQAGANDELVKVGGGTNGSVRIRNNLGHAPAMSPGAGGRVISVQNTTVFAEYDDNVWSVTSNPSSPGNIFSVAGTGEDLITWNLRSGIGTDVTTGVSLDSNKVPTTGAADVADRSDYARYDRNDDLRPSSSATAGATQRATGTAPAAPSNLTAAALNPSVAGVVLNWTDNASNETHFVIERKLVGGTFAALGTQPAANSGTFTDNTVVPGTTYVYRIKAVNGSGSSGWSNELTTTSLAVPAMPTNVSVINISTTSARLSWMDNSNDETNFYVYYGPDSGPALTATAPANATSLVLNDLSGTIFLRVQAQNAAGFSAYETIVATSLSSGYISQDIGAPSPSGSGLTVTPEVDYDVTTTNSEIWGTADTGHFVSKQVAGDFDIKVRVASVGSADLLARAGLMAREALAGNSRHAYMAMTPATGTDQGFKFITRGSTGGSSSVAGQGTRAGGTANWVRLRRVGNQLIGYYSTDGANWTLSSAKTFSSLGSSLYVGMAASSNHATPATMQFRDLNEFASGFGTLTVRGTDSVDTLSAATGSSNINVTVGSETVSHTATDIVAITVSARGGADTITSNVTGKTVTIDGGSALDAVTVSGGTAQFTSSQDFSSLTVSGGIAKLTQGGAKTLLTNSLSVSGSGKLDLTDNDMIIDYASTSPLGAWDGSAYTGVSGLIDSGRSGGTWDGNGIMTSVADLDGPYTGLGIAEASDVLGLSGTGTALWNGVTVDATAVLVKYTYLGDANLSGHINVDDYGRIDANVGNPNVHGYANGDFNYDGLINVDDYGLIDANVSAQGDPL